VGGVGLLLSLGGPVAGILHFQRRCDNQHVGQTPLAVGFENHPPDARIDRQAGELPADGSELSFFVDGS
jgi:hypothetical protein